MSNTVPTPSSITLHKRSRVLEIAFDDGAEFGLSCEYLRAFSPSAEVKVDRMLERELPSHAGVSITAIEPVGSYAVRLRFDDGHDTGVYSWETLYALGRDHDQNWAAYRGGGAPSTPATTVPLGRPAKLNPTHLLYFGGLPDTLGRTADDFVLPADVDTVETLLRWLESRSSTWRETLATSGLEVTVNKAFANEQTPVGEGDEVSLTVPTR